MSAYDPANRDLNDGTVRNHASNKRGLDLRSTGERLRKQRAQDRAQLQQRLASQPRYVPEPQASPAKTFQRSYGRARSQPQRQKSGTPPWLLFSVAVATGILFVLGSKPTRQRRVRPLANSSRRMDYTSPAYSSAYPDGPGMGDQHLSENTSVLGSDPYVDNDATDRDGMSKLQPVAEIAVNKKQGWGETKAKSDGTFPSDGSHLVTQAAKSHPAGSEKGSSFGTGAPARPPASIEGRGSGSRR
jgi:hypothetical protein